MKKAIIFCRLAAIDQKSTTQLSKQKEDCLAYAKAHNYEVIKVISEAGLSGLDQSRQGKVAPNLLDQQFTATKPNQVWLADITYIATAF